MSKIGSRGIFPDTELMTTMPTSTKDHRDKTLSACDECRTRKLKCSGEPTGCSRCKSEGSSCHYSQRKAMGRPRKRRREDAGDTAHMDRNMGSSEGRDVDAEDVGLQDLDLTTFSGNEPSLGIDNFQFLDDSLGRHDMVSFDAGSRSSLGLPEGSAFDFEQGFSNWDPLPDRGQPFVDVPLQLQTPPSAPDELDHNNQIAGDAVTGCACLSNLYSTLAKFQSLPEPSFPYSMGALRSAAALSRGVVACQSCTQAYNTALQNSMLLGTLLQLLIMEYAKLLRHIDERSKQSEKVTFRLGDPSSMFDSRHTGLPDCPMAINVDLSGDEWRTLARKAVAQEVLGNSERSSGLIGLVQAMKDRQASWQGRFSMNQCTLSHSAEHEHNAKHLDHQCVHRVYTDNLRRSIDALGL